MRKVRLSNSTQVGVRHVKGQGFGALASILPAVLPAVLPLVSQLLGGKGMKRKPRARKGTGTRLA